MENLKVPLVSVAKSCVYLVPWLLKQPVAALWLLMFLQPQIWPNSEVYSIKVKKKVILFGKVQQEESGSALVWMHWWIFQQLERFCLVCCRRVVALTFWNPACHEYNGCDLRLGCRPIPKLVLFLLIREEWEELTTHELSPSSPASQKLCWKMFNPELTSSRTSVYILSDISTTRRFIWFLKHRPRRSYCLWPLFKKHFTTQRSF